MIAFCQAAERANGLFRQLLESLDQETVLLGNDSLGEALWCVSWMDGDDPLANDWTSIVLTVHDMYGKTRLCLSVLNYSLMHPHTIHAVPAVFRQQGRVNVNDLALEAL